jgi:hypothetical protein
MLYSLKVPDALSGGRIQCKQRLRKKRVAYAIGAIEVARCRACRHVDYALLFVEGHASPLLAEPEYFHASFGQVSQPNSPGCGIV